MPSWLKPVFSLLLLAPLILGNGECNSFTGSANKNSDDALMYSARLAVDKKDFDGAIEIMSRISADRRGSRDGRVLEATAYAGKCGLNFIGLAKEIVDKIQFRRLFEVLGSNMRSVTSYEPCATAETVIRGIPPEEMKSDDYIFLAFLEFAKIGAVLAADGAIDANGSVVGTYDSCAMSDQDAGEIGTGINLAVSAIVASGIPVAGSTTSIVKALCDVIETIPPGDLSPCGIYDPSGFSADQLRAIRIVTQSNEIGLNTCGGSVTDLPCVCL